MDDWSGWSGCSKDCGGGVMSRSRNIEVEPDFKGKECGATTDTQMCNVDACNVPCELEDWGDWSTCSKACSGGIEVRRKAILVPAKGTGYCAEDTDEERFEYRPCLYGGAYVGLPACPPNLVCDSEIDMMLLMDGSGSVGNKGFGKEKKFAEEFINRFEVSSEQTEVGIISFSWLITIGTQITDSTEDLMSVVDSTEWEGASTNTAAALGKTLDMDALYQWASFPPEYNILTSKGFGKLAKNLNKGEYLPDICPNLICRETIDTATDPTGVNYIGCQA